MRQWLSLKNSYRRLHGRHPERSRFSGVVRDLACSKAWIAHARSLSRLKYAGFRDDAFEGWVRNSKLSHYRTSTFLDKQVAKAQRFNGVGLVGSELQGCCHAGRIATSSGEIRVETAIGVFASRDHAEAAVKDLLRHGVPEPAIVFLTRTEGDVTTTGSGQEVAAVPGPGKEPAGITSSASMVVPGVGRVFALGARAAGL